MILGRAARYLFVEPPFTGSTAIARELVEMYGGESVLWKHAKYPEAEAELDVDLDDYFVFASNRTPLDQVVSEFLKLKHNHRGNYTNEAMFQRNGGFVTDEALEEFAWIQENDASFPEYFQRYKNVLYNNWFLLGHEKFDYILDFTKLADEFEHVLRRIGIEPARRLPHVNPTRGKKPWIEYFTPETYEQAFRCYGPFMRKWGFEFPSEWGRPRIPLASRLRFALLDRGVRAVSRFMLVDSYSPRIQRWKRLAQSMRG